VGWRCLLAVSGQKYSVAIGPTKIMVPWSNVVPQILSSTNFDSDFDSEGVVD
jgi:hypothetical protein